MANGVIYAFVGPALAIILVSENVCGSRAGGIGANPTYQQQQEQQSKNIIISTLTELTIIS